MPSVVPRSLLMMPTNGKKDESYTMHSLVLSDRKKGRPLELRQLADASLMRNCIRLQLFTALQPTAVLARRWLPKTILTASSVALVSCCFALP
jgi:hypothetical protein